MRRTLSFTLVLLLVLRGLLGDAMAMGMSATTQSAAPVQHAMAGVASRLSDMVDLAEVADRTGPPQSPMNGLGTHAANGQSSDAVVAHVSAAPCPPADAGGADHCGQASDASCSACSACHTAVFPSALLVQPLPLEAGAVPCPGQLPFVSASAALAIKPPIS